MNEQTKKLVKLLEPYFSKLPPLPASAREFLVSIAPWVALIVGILSVVGAVSTLLGIGRLTAMTALVPGGAALTGWFWIASLLGLVGGVLWLLAFQPLKGRSVRGWNLLFWILVLQLVGSVVATVFYFNVTSLLWALIWWVIGFYILFQLRSYYK